MREEQIGECRLILGDCREVLPRLGKVDAVVTSPPYGQQRKYGRDIQDWRSLVSGALLAVNCREDTQFLVNLGLIHRDGECVEYWGDLKRDMRAAGWRLFGWYVWDQMSGMAGDWNGRLAPSFEFVFHYNKNARTVNKTKPTKGGVIHGPGLRSVSGSATSTKTHDRAPVQPFKIPDSVIRTPRETQGGIPEAEHPARFPVSFARELIQPFTDAGDIVCDPFMGSGTTGVACANLERRFIGVEIEPRYFDIACRRIEEAYKQPRLFAEPKPKPKQVELL